MPKICSLNEPSGISQQKCFFKDKKNTRYDHEINYYQYSMNFYAYKIVSEVLFLFLLGGGGGGVGFKVGHTLLIVLYMYTRCSISFSIAQNLLLVRNLPAPAGAF